MSAVIWFGIVAVWAFVLIPTWVRRSDIHWRRSGDASGARDKLGRAARVISRPGTRGSSTTRTTRTAVPSMRRPSAGAATATRRPTVAAGARAGRATAVMDAETETLPPVRMDEPPTQQMSAIVDAPAAHPIEPDPVTATATSAQVADATAPEAPMDTTRTPRPAPRRAAPAASKVTPPPHVQRARRLVWIGATALATLLLAFVFGGWWILLNLLADVALVGYLRYLRGIAKQKLARKARAQTTRAASPSEDLRERAATPARPQRRAAATPRHRADAPVARRSAPVAPLPPRATAPSTRVDPAAGHSPEFIDLTDESLPDDAMNDDCPTTELIAARAV